LNEAAPDTPTFMLFLYSRGMINRAAVQALGLTEATKAPEGGRYEFVDGGAILHLEMGIPVGAGTDGTRVSSYNPWPSLYWLVSGKTTGGTQLFADDNTLSREDALRLFTVGSAWFSQEEAVKGRIAPGQYTGFAVLSDDYFTIPEEQIKNIEAVLTVVAGKVVYAAKPFDAFAPPALPPVSPDWSPVAHFGGYQNQKKAERPR
jgi:predicted amidohydrolase YtcJ